MNAVTRKIVLLLSLAAFSMNAACTTIKPIDVDEQTTYAQQIKVGDKVRLLSWTSV